MSCDMATLQKSPENGRDLTQAAQSSEKVIDKSAIDSLTRQLSVSGSSGGDMLSNLRNMDLSDDFWMYGFKVTTCTKPYSHKWTFCPCGHAGETARRRDPQVLPYKANLCPLSKAKQRCPLGDSCLWSHNVFEHWLHPSRYKTRLCTYAGNCNRAICFFAHNAEELRCVPGVDVNKDTDTVDYMTHLMHARQARQAETSDPAPMPPMRSSMSSTSTQGGPLPPMRASYGGTPGPSYGGPSPRGDAGSQGFPPQEITRARLQKSLSCNPHLGMQHSSPGFVRGSGPLGSGPLPYMSPHEGNLALLRSMQAPGGLQGGLGHTPARAGMSGGMVNACSMGQDLGRHMDHQGYFHASSQNMDQSAYLGAGDPYWNLGGPHLPPAVRQSDPGLPGQQQMMLNNMLAPNQYPNYNRNSDSGQTFGLPSSFEGFDLAELETLISTLNRTSPQDPPPEVPNYMLNHRQPERSHSHHSSHLSQNNSYISTQSSSGMYTGAQVPPQPVLLRAHQGSPDSQVNQNLYQRSSSEPGAMLDLVSQLQDMGGNKEEMVASISSLLAELMYVQ